MQESISYLQTTVEAQQRAIRKLEQAMQIVGEEFWCGKYIELPGFRPPKGFLRGLRGGLDDSAGPSGPRIPGL